MGRPDDPEWLDPSKTLGSTTLTDIRLPTQTEQRLRGTLLVISGTPADLGVHLLVRGEVIVGRDFGQLKLRDGRVSRRHVRVWEETDGRYMVEDMRSTNGTLLNGRALEVPTHVADGDKVYLGGTVLKFTLVDETEARYLERMERLAGTDPLTGLHAKHRFDSMLEEALRQARLSREPLCMMMMDMDGLKAINDRHGHRMGAHTIATVGKAIGEVLRGRGEACRFGGDEFSAYLPRLSEARCRLAAEEIRLVVEDGVYELDGAQVNATISIGMAFHDESITSVGALVAAADQALYRAKAAGRNCVSL